MKTDAELFYTPGKANPGPAYLTETNTAKAKYKKPTKLLEKPDAIVIGSGIGGLGIASILAQRRGYRVLLLEAGPTPGGCTHCHEIDGFEFASGVDSIGDMDPRVGRGMFRPTIDYLTGGTLEWAKMPDIHEICAIGDETYEWFSSPEKNIEWVERRFPNQGRVRDYYELEEQIEASATAWGVTKLMPEWIPVSAREKFYKTFGGKWRKYMSRSTTSVFRDELGFSKQLTAVFTYMYGNHGRTPDHAPFAFHAANLLHYRNGAYFPVGGPAHIAECIVPIIEKAGGQLAVSCAVDKILVEGNKTVGVRLEDGQEIRCPLVISDASAHVTFMDLLDRDLAERHGYAARFTDGAAGDGKVIGPSPAHLYLLLGYDEAIELPKHIIWHMPTYEGIDRYDLSGADDLYKRDMKLDGMGGYLLSPSARDPVHAQRYPNKSTVVALAEAPPSWVQKANGDPTFREELRAGVTENLMKLVHRHMPMLAGKTPKLVRAGVPMGCNPRAWHGCSLGLEPSGERFVEHTHWLRPKTLVDGLYLTGQDSFSAGFAGSMASARLTYSVLSRDWFFMLDTRL